MHNGAHHLAQDVELGDRIVVAAQIGAETGDSPRELEFDVVGILGEPDGDERYAICYCETVDEFMVTDAAGQLLADASLAQRVLNEFLEHAEGLGEGSS